MAGASIREGLATACGGSQWREPACTYAGWGVHASPATAVPHAEGDGAQQRRRVVRLLSLLRSGARESVGDVAVSTQSGCERLSSLMRGACCTQRYRCSMECDASESPAVCTTCNVWQSGEAQRARSPCLDLSDAC